ncbi:MAG: hypothetical protein HQL16_05510 [Candidatus Omnitrophica bacterium]|nr:hypothetical protein [Candidatus Omnitrophota bacterium]
MSKTTFAQKIALIFLGVALTFLALECVLRFGGFVFHCRQEMMNKASFSDDEIRILCIGESTTALGDDNSYPAILKTVLNQKSGTERFKVINKGMVSKNTRDILDQLNDNLTRYRPHIVVAMIGVNDTPQTRGAFARQSWTEAFGQWRVCKLIFLLKQHLAHRLAGNKNVPTSVKNTFAAPGGLVPPDALGEQYYVKINQELRPLQSSMVQVSHWLQTPGIPDATKKELAGKAMFLQEKIRQDYKLIGIFHFINKDYPAAQKALEIALKLNPHDPSVLFEYARTLRAQKFFPQAFMILEQASAVVPQEPLVWMEMAETLSDMGKIPEARAIFLKTAGLNPPDQPWLYLQIGSWFKNNNFLDDAERALETSYQMNTWNLTTIDLLEEVYEALGRADKLKNLRAEAARQNKRANNYFPATAENYNEIVKAVHARGAVMVAMQYPLRPISTLKALFPSKEKIIFVENRTNFLAALQKGDFSRYFWDNFAGDFGHCSPLGNRMIAENLANVLWEKVPLARK